VDDPAVSRVLAAPLGRRGAQVFALDGVAIGAEDVNERLSGLSGGAVTAKDFRTWRGTLVAFTRLRGRPPATPDRHRDVLEAIDAAAEALTDTRAIARAHYVHPQLVDSYLSGRFRTDLAARRPGRRAGPSPDERRLLPLLDALFERCAAGGLAANPAG
jgi:DNA topoisomerase-1